MKKSTQKILALSVLGIFVLVLALQFVSAASVFDPIKDWFTNWEQGNISNNVAKYLFAALVFMVIFGIADKLPFFDTENLKWIRWPFAIIIAFLSMAYITPEEIYGIMNNYNALGWVLSAFLPLIILAFFTFSLAGGAQNKRSVQRVLLRSISWVLWLAFLAFVVVKAINAPEGNALWYWIVVAADLLVILFFGAMWRKVRKEVGEEQVRRLREKTYKQSQKRNIEAEDVERQ